MKGFHLRKGQVPVWQCVRCQQPRAGHGRSSDRCQCGTLANQLSWTPRGRLVVTEEEPADRGPGTVEEVE